MALCGAQFVSKDAEGYACGVSLSVASADGLYSARSGVDCAEFACAKAIVGCVGIGTLAPATPLQVYGISRFSRTDSTPSGTANTVLNDAVFGSTDTANTGITLLGTGQVGIAFGDAASTEIGQVRYQHSTNAMEFRTNGAEAMMIDNAGCVGIGTTAPDGELHVFSGESSGVAPNVAADELILEGSGDVGMTIFSGASSSASIFFADTGSALDGYIQYYQHDQSMTFGTAAATRMKIVSSGNVGIGTATPDGNLHVMSSSAGSVTAHSNACTGVFEASDYAGISIIGASESSIHFADAGSNIVSRIHYDHGGNNLAIDTNSAEVMRLTSAGNVGIGTTAPAKILSVYGALDTTVGTDPVARFERTGASQTGITVRSNDIDGLILRADSTGFGAIHSYDDLGFYTGATPGSAYGTVRMRIEKDNGYVGINTTAPAGQLDIVSSDNINQQFNCLTHASGTGTQFWPQSTRAASSSYQFFYATSGGTSDVEFWLKGDGNAYADGTWNDNGADYAEFFESTTDTALDQGRTVVLEECKVRYYDAAAGDTADDIFGVVRPADWSKNSMVIGNTAWNMHHDKYLTDEWGVYILSDVPVKSWTDSETNKEYAVYENPPPGVDIDPDYNWSTAPASATITCQAERTLNPNYDESCTYISREDRPEWNIVGLLGQVQIATGQITRSNWIKMCDISSDVQLWLIR